MKISNMLKQWQSPIRKRVEDCLRLESELSLYHRAANDEGGNRMDSGGSIREQLNTLAVQLRSACGQVPLSVLREVYKGVELQKVLLGEILEQLIGGKLHFNEPCREEPGVFENLREIHAGASYPCPTRTSPLGAVLRTPVIFKGLNESTFERCVEVFLHQDFVRHVNVRSNDLATWTMEPIELTILGFEEEVANLAQRYRIDCGGDPDQVSKNCFGANSWPSDWSDDSIINSARDIFDGPQDEALLVALEDSEAGFAWYSEHERFYQGLRLWSEDHAGNCELLGVGESGLGVIYFGESVPEEEMLLSSPV